MCFGASCLHYSHVSECRFKYTHNFLRWALQPPGYIPEWHIGVRVKGNNKLVGFITGALLLANAAITVLWYFAFQSLLTTFLKQWSLAGAQVLT